MCARARIHTHTHACMFPCALGEGGVRNNNSLCKNAVTISAYLVNTQFDWGSVITKLFFNQPQMYFAQ